MTTSVPNRPVDVPHTGEEKTHLEDYFGAMKGATLQKPFVCRVVSMLAVFHWAVLPPLCVGFFLLLWYARCTNQFVSAVLAFGDTLPDLVLIHRRCAGRGQTARAMAAPSGGFPVDARLFPNRTRPHRRTAAGPSVPVCVPSPRHHRVRCRDGCGDRCVPILVQVPRDRPARPHACVELHPSRLPRIPARAWLCISRAQIMRGDPAQRAWPGHHDRGGWRAGKSECKARRDGSHVGTAHGVRPCRDACRVRVFFSRSADLVPTIGFGENDLYEQADNDENSWVYWLQQTAKKCLGFTVPLIAGRGISQNAFGCMPFQRPVNVVGTSSALTQSGNPSRLRILLIPQRSKSRKCTNGTQRRSSSRSHMLTQTVRRA